MNRTIVVTGIEPAPLSLRWPLGINLDLKVKMIRQNGTAIDPTHSQFVLLPRSKGGAYPHDMEAFDVPGGIASIEIPGLFLQDPLGYNIELYTRRENSPITDPLIPTGLAAKGVLVTEGSAYTQNGPLAMINIPVITGPPGPPGEQGVRGSVWTTGSGDPTMQGNEQTGDMYLNEFNGDVWRYDGGAAMWVRGSF